MLYYTSGASLDELTPQQHLILLHVTDPPSEVSESGLKPDPLLASTVNEKHVQYKHTPRLKPERCEGGSRRGEFCQQRQFIREPQVWLIPQIHSFIFRVSIIIVLNVCENLKSFVDCDMFFFFT